MSDYNIRIGAEFDGQATLDSIKNQLDSLTKSPQKIRVSLDMGNINSEIANIKKQLQGLGLKNTNINLGGGSSLGLQKNVSEANKAYSDLMNMAKKINSIRIKISGLDSGANANQIKELSNQLNSLMTTYNNVYNTFTKGLDTSQIQSYKQQITSVQQEIAKLEASAKTMSKQGIDVSQTKQRIADLKTELSALQTTFQNISNGLSASQVDNLANTFANTTAKVNELNAKLVDTKTKLADAISAKSSNMAKVQTEMSQVNVVSAELKSSFASLSASYSELNSAQSTYSSTMSNSNSSDKQKVQAIESLISANNKYKASLKETQNLLKMNASTGNTLKLQDTKNAFSTKIDAWLKTNSAAVKSFGGEIRNIQAQIQSADATSLSRLQTQFQEVTARARAAGVATQSFGDRLKTSMTRLTSYFSGVFVIMKTIQTLKDMAKNVLEVDTAMTELYRVTNLTSAEYSDLYDKMTNSAKQYGTTLSGIIKSTASWVRLGFDPNDASGLAEVTSMYQHVSDLDESTAIENLVTAYKGFETQLLELHNGDSVAAVENIADIYDKLNNEFAESAADVGEGLSKAASVLAQGGASIEESAGM